ncbi:MAG TPA: kelch repeat-containing protein [Kofleriaceae bacterium]|nr:kelch repeat-containing protein [Kofleriaceae bacterium]
MRTWLALALCGCLSKPGPARFLGRTWTKHHELNFAAPGQLFVPKLVYDESIGKVLLYGGEYSQSPPYWSSSMYELDSDGWTQVCGGQTACPPGGRSDFGFVYDPQGRRSILFGGESDDTGTETTLADGWAYAGGTWQSLPSLTIPPMQDIHMVYDTNAQRALIVVGFSLQTAPEQGVYTISASDVTTFTELSGGQQVADRNATGAYDPTRDRVLAFPGIDPFGGYYRSMASYSPDTGQWTTLCDSCLPAPERKTPAMVFDRQYGNVVMIGGLEIDDSTHENDVLGWNDDEAQFDQLAELGEPRSGAGAAYDASTDTIVLYGGGTDLATTDPDCPLADSAQGQYAYCADTWLGTPNFAAD